MEIGYIPVVIQYGDKIEVKPHKTGAWGWLSVCSPDATASDDDPGLEITFRDAGTARRMATYLNYLADQMEAAQKARRRDADPQAGNITTPVKALTP